MSRMEYIPEKTARIKPYGFEDASGVTVKLDANESFVSLPGRLREKLAEIAANADYNRYPDPISASATEAYGKYLGVPPENIVAGNGSDELISLIESSLLSGGDKLLCAAPDFSMYKFYSGLAEVEFCEMKKKNDFSIDVAALGKMAKQTGAKAVMFSNPCSPTGLGISREEAILSATANPAKQIGRAGEIGAIAPGMLADFVVCTEALERICVYMGGEKL